jgi:hypothetical protein
VKSIPSDYIFGLPGNAVLSRMLEPAADDVRVRRAETQAPVLRRYAETRYGAKSWGRERRIAARIEASTMGLDIRCVVTNLVAGSAEWLYDTLYCARGQAENLIKLQDAAASFDPVTSQGLGNALGTALAAAGAIVSDLHLGPEAQQGYCDVVWASFANTERQRRAVYGMIEGW